MHHDIGHSPYNYNGGSSPQFHNGGPLGHQSAEVHGEGGKGPQSSTQHSNASPFGDHIQQPLSSSAEIAGHEGLEPGHINDPSSGNRDSSSAQASDNVKPNPFGHHAPSAGSASESSKPAGNEREDPVTRT